MATTTERGYHNTSSDRDALRRFAGSGSLMFPSARSQNEAVDVLLNLIEQDGAGQWPPLVVYDDWPSALQLYKDIYHEVVPQLSSSSPLLDHDTLMVRRESFRSQMRELLKELINLLEVERLLNAAEAEFAKRLHYTTHVA
ncbi:hypothetical protein PCH_Pc21g13000 [Penicillium rubens Wisconsin 54-1255]|uniref:Uncharacterized protein n=1 Tax=Penicillium rubens (strain ATCC 28089 / DSM 1075 / NRRL 1951 / Wisconsin 54-1255) TaxID=500485 RepID=B6HMF5_PENRW|nr:hypothetical protein PCH_Pc21g13000 [Penicillium rubens Wisconsin 54-1255]